LAAVDLISFAVDDVDGKRGHVHCYVPATYTLAQLQTFAENLAGDLDAVTGAKIASITVTKSLTLPGGLKANATASHYINQGANFAFDAADTDYRHTMRVPAILESLCTGDVVNVAAGAGKTFADQVTVGDGVVSPSDRYGNDLVSTIEATRTFRTG
jgi:hypothetical protein